MISTGLSDKLVVTIMKTTFIKRKPQEIEYRCYKKFDYIYFKQDLCLRLASNVEVNTNFSLFQNIFLQVLNRHAPLKKKLIRANEVPDMTKALRKAIMTRSRLDNQYHKNKSIDEYNAFKKQRNFCNRLYKRERKTFYSNLHPKNITDNEKFWNTMKPFFLLIRAL